MEPDFSGFATKANLRCSDGRTILSDAFKHMDGTKVPLVWQHAHNEPSNVLGHMQLEARGGDVYGYGFFNDSDAAVNAKSLVKHGDITALSIYANKLVEKDKAVMHGTIREVSLVLAGANPGALIDNVNIAHSDGSLDTLDDEAIIYTGLPIAHSEESTETMGNKTIGDIFDTLNDEQKGAVGQMLESALAHAEDDDKDKEKVDTDKEDDDKDSGSGEKTVKQIFDGMTEEQKNVVYFMIGQALDEAKGEKTETKSSSDSDETKSTAKHDNFSEGSTTMSHNVFDKDAVTGADTTPALSHADSASIFEGAKRLGSIKEAAEDYALQHGIEDIDVLFPDAKAISSTPEFIARRTEWVSEVMTGTRKTPFSRIKSLTANLTLEEARAKGYIKGNLKKEEFFRVAKRVTTPQTIYKKQKLDRDDILDITDFDVVAWLKGEMRLMLEEEIARAVLLGDGRSAGDDDKISEDHVRPIANEDELYVTYLYVNTGGAEYTAEEIIDSLTLQRRHYRGSGNPTFFTSETVLAQLLLIKDKMGRRIYPTVNDLSAALRVSKIVAVEVMDEPSVDILGVMVNLQDYTIGADKGGDVALFDDFDIDYNQYKYLIETRISGALVKAKSAVVIKAVAGGTLVRPTAPTWDDEDKTVTVPTVTGVTYKNKLTNATLTTASPVELTPDEELTVIAVPASSSYYLASSAEDEWMFDGDRGQISGAF
ncbi:head maturation protease [Gordonia phage Chikenjars]|uniref:Major capsid and protease fusion protein n=1 Tax=Gordonia phage Chikenjars TaxID=2601686 RepID=A0A5J6D9Y4_9CAUD|nr:head maturation protease [Gordonia phage Chikenjars]QEQ94325.1 major capsid and protease fusion protein [Gordonia phage Chikenjars]QXO14046.1 major capsid and protease fusion protein [Gordonia phage AlainaMarie]